MIRYLSIRLLLFPITLFAILLINFVILNLAPGDPTQMMDGGKTGELNRSESGRLQALEDPYFQFREHFGLTLPILFNRWPAIDQKAISAALTELSSASSGTEHHQALLRWGDRARFLMVKLLHIADDTSLPFEVRKVAFNLFVRGGFRLGHFGSHLSSEAKLENRKIENDNRFLLSLHLGKEASLELLNQQVVRAQGWLEKNSASYPEVLSTKESITTFFTQTRFARYFNRLAHFDFGVLRTDASKSVTAEVGKRIKYSLTLAVIPMILSFGLAQLFGMIMALNHGKWLDHSLNTLFLILYPIPVFVFAPFLIEKVALGHTLPFTDIPIPISAFQSDAAHYSTLSSLGRLADIALHLVLPIASLLYWMIAIQAKLARTTFLETLHQDYIKTARAKGLPTSMILIKHVGRNASITAVTALASSIGLILTGALLVETLFNIHGFGRFFYEAILNRDYNVILFSAIAGSALTLIGYLLADIAYLLLDPRMRGGLTQ